MNMKDKTGKEEKKEAEPVVRVLTPEERKRLLIEGIKKTAFPAFLGAFFTLVFYIKFFDARNTSWFSALLLVMLVSYVIQKAVYPYLGVRVDKFETKDWFYVEFMTIIFMLVFWTLMLNIGALEVTASPDSLVSGAPGNVVASVTSNGVKIEGAAVRLAGEDVNVSAFTGSDGIAYFNGVTASGEGNLTLTAEKTGYARSRTNITVTAPK